MKINHAPSFRRTRLASACGLLLAGVTAVHAQGAASAAAPASAASAVDRSDVQSVTVTGIRASLETSLALKRDAHGIVDGITAEDVGKFPDTNLAEAMQRISGVAIDRVAGEGSKITVRGFGPDYNMILLNGRQMPATTILDTAASGSRAFDFANLASESISSLEVWKTSQASKPAGGIGATINIRTARPLDNPRRIASIGVKADVDEADKRLPNDDRRPPVTPEVSGIYSDTFADHTVGVAITGSYQLRDGGYNTAGVTSGWHTCQDSQDGSNCWGGIPKSSPTITNRPTGAGIYSTPQNVDYAVNGIRRERVNGQMTLQWQPVQAFTGTMDFTFAQNTLDTRRSDLSSWFSFGPSASSWTSGAVSAPLFYTEYYNDPSHPNADGTAGPGLQDVAMGGGKYGVKTTLRSVGLNALWKITNTLKVEADAHTSNSVSGSDSPYGTNSDLGTASFNRGSTTVDFTHDFPVMSLANTSVDASKQLVTGSSFRNGYMKSGVNQLQLKGAWEATDQSSVDFGLNLQRVSNRSAYANVQQDTWGGATSAADYPDSVWHLNTLNNYFSQVSGSKNSALFNNWYTFNFDQVRGIAASVGDPTHYLASSNFDGPGSVDRRTRETTTSLYGQYNRDWETWSMPMNLSAGLRYEKTDVTSTASVPVGTGINWVSQNELDVTYGGQGFTSLKGSYHYLLPSIDFDAGLLKDVKLRLSYGDTIARPDWTDIQGGQSIDQLVRVNGGTGSQGNPNLKPLRSHNLDASLEWYYGKASYASIGFFHKNVSNFIGQSTVTATPFNLATPVGGAYWNAALANGCSATNTTCIRNYIFAHYNGQPGVAQTGTDSTGNAVGTISGTPGDPITNFTINTPVNAAFDSLHGFEFNVQAELGHTGFGVAANYTVVISGLRYNNSSTAAQYALPGLSNTANLVAYYEDDHYNARVAYNWRGQFLAATIDGGGFNNPTYTQAYSQVDATLGWNVTDHLSLTLDGINLNDGVIRQHERTKEELVSVTQTGRRYMIGARYKF